MQVRIRRFNDVEQALSGVSLGKRALRLQPSVRHYRHQWRPYWVYADVPSDVCHFKVYSPSPTRTGLARRG
ncbi:MAG: hypothetical protein ACK55I_05385 [bacterium]